MKSIIPVDEFGMVECKGQAVTSTLYVSEYFLKEHKNVLRDYDALDCSEEFRRLNFEPSSYKNEQNKKQPMVLMTKNGFLFLVMGYRGKKAAEIKEQYIKHFDLMEQFITDIYTARAEYPILTDAVKEAHNPVKRFHFSNEADLLNRIVIGKAASKFREEHDLPKGTSIRPYVSPFEIKAMQALQGVNAGLILAKVGFEERKEILGRQIETMRERESYKELKSA